jgi:hypothetical protein
MITPYRPVLAYLLGGALACLSTWAAASPPKTFSPDDPSLSAEVCIERLGDNGLLNVIVADVDFGSAGSVSLPGESAACLYLMPGDVIAQATSSNPYPAAGGPSRWQSSSLHIHVGGGSLTKLYVCGRGGGPHNSYMGWQIVTAEHRRQCVP